MLILYDVLPQYDSVSEWYNKEAVVRLVRDRREPGTGAVAKAQILKQKLRRETKAWVDNKIKAAK